jgi:hypothetical protein
LLSNKVVASWFTREKGMKIFCNRLNWWASKLVHGSALERRFWKKWNTFSGRTASGSHFL